MTSVPRRVGVTVPIPGVRLHEHREWYEEIAALGYTDVWTGEANSHDGFTPLALAAASGAGDADTAAKAFEAVVSLLQTRHAYSPTLWSYALLHNVVPAAREFLQHSDGIVNDSVFTSKFPYLGTPASGYSTKPGVPHT